MTFVLIGDGKGVTNDLVKARALHRQASDAGSFTGKITYGLDCLMGDTGDKDLSMAGIVLRPIITYLQKNEDELTSGEFFTLMLWYSRVNGNLVKPNPSLVEKYANLIIESKGRLIGGDDALARGVMYNLLGMMCLEGAENSEKAKLAFEYFQREKATYDKDGTADYWLGHCYDDGIGVEVDVEKALEHYERAVDKGNAGAQCALALKLLDDDAEPDVERGKMLLRLAAEGGDSDAEWVYGSWLIGGMHFEKNIQEGMKWLEKAVCDNNVGAMNTLGQQYRDGNDVVSIDYVKAFKLFEQGALGGSADAMDSLGFAYLNGQGVVRDVLAAEKWFIKAAKSGDADAECSLGTRFFNGEFGNRDVGEAIKWWVRAAEHGDTVAMVNLGTLYRDGDGVEKNVHKAEEWFVQAADAGNEDAACKLGAGYYNGVFGEPDKKRALEWSLRAAKLGDVTAMTNLGIMYRDGDGVEMNLARAIDWFRQAADGGYPDAMTNLGFAYLNGDGVDIDKKAAEEWFVKAAEEGDADAEEALGTRYAEGAFEEVDYVKAVAWWLKSARQGQAVAMWNLGCVYRRGEKGVDKDLRQSFNWFKQSAEAGYVEAMESLGISYLQGLGTVADEDKAKEWLIRAAENGNSSAECTLGALYARDDYWDKDLAEAVKWWTQAAEHENAQAMCNLGQLFSDTDLDGGAIQFDLDKARKWFRDADEAGNEEAAYFLGLDVLSALDKRYETYSDWQTEFKEANPEFGVGKRILRKAGSWFQKPLDIPTADDDLAGACLRWLARIARYQEDLENTKDLYRQAAEKGDEKAKKELAEIDTEKCGVEEHGAVMKVPAAAPVVVQGSAESDVPSLPQAAAVQSRPDVPSASSSDGDTLSQVEALFLRKVRLYKKNDGQIDDTEEGKLRKWAEEFHIPPLRREELILQVEEEYEASR